MSTLFTATNIWLAGLLVAHDIKDIEDAHSWKDFEVVSTEVAVFNDLRPDLVCLFLATQLEKFF